MSRFICVILKIKSPIKFLLALELFSLSFIPFLLRDLRNLNFNFLLFLSLIVIEGALGLRLFVNTLSFNPGATEKLISLI